jgi:hypothetical protein
MSTRHNRGADMRKSDMSDTVVGEFETEISNVIFQLKLLATLTWNDRSVPSVLIASASILTEALRVYALESKRLRLH